MLESVLPSSSSSEQPPAFVIGDGEGGGTNNNTNNSNSKRKRRPAGTPGKLLKINTFFCLLLINYTICCLMNE